jgi:photosystem II stability/assembly factor-like uncharacterized protein
MGYYVLSIAFLHQEIVVATEAQTAFFSYSRDDSEFALRLAEDLKAAGANVWMDQIDLVGGQRWTEAVQAALENCPRVLAILSPSAVGSANVMDEVTFALDEKKTVIPVLHRDCKIPYRLRSLHHIDFRGDYARGLTMLLRALGVQPPPPTGPAPSAESPPVVSAAVEQKPAREETQVSRQRKQPFVNFEGQVRWLKQNWKWALPAWLVFCLSAAAIALHFMGDSEVSKLAFARAQSDLGVAQRLGEPVKRGWFVTGNVEGGGSTGHADLAIALSGPKGKGKLYVVATEHAGQWTFETLQLKLEGEDKRIDLLQSAVPQSGWILGEEGIMLHTEDGGRTWKTQTNSLAGGFRLLGLGSADLRSACFVSAWWGWVVGRLGYILHTEDGGSHWTMQTGDTDKWLESVAFATSQSGWVVGEGGTILHSEDGGGTWRAQDSSTKDWLNSVAFATPQSGWAVGGIGTILHTEDAGATWKLQSSGISAELFSVAFVTPQSGWAVGKGGTILHTGDGGRTWNAQSSGTKSRLYSVAFATLQSGWAVGDNGTILHTEDGGATWKAQTSGSGQDLWSVAFLSPQSGWGVGAGGTILHTEDGGSTWTQQTSGTSEALRSIAFAKPNRVPNGAKKKMLGRGF